MKAIRLFILLISVSMPCFPKNAMILYDGPREGSEAFKSARYIHNLLGHFSLDDTRVLPVSDYEPGAALVRDIVFLVFEEGRPETDQRLLADLTQMSGTIVWINLHIEKLLETESAAWRLKHEGWQERTDWRVLYRGEDFPKEDPGLNIVRLENPEDGRICAEAVDGDGLRHPYILETANLWYVADAPYSYALEGGRYLVLADLLHDILDEDHPAESRALLRIEDVNPETNPEDLLSIAAYLSREKVPFQVSLIPIYRNPDIQYESYLSDRPDLIAALKEMVGKGGTLILHGATHQHRGTTGEDYEFWDDIAGGPIPHESPDWVDERLKAALFECFRNGLYPLAWETPHYSASQSDYRTFSRYFDTFYDRVMAAELSGTQQIFPYVLKLRDLGITVIPENMGYVSIRNPDPARLLQNAKNMRVVRDGTASFFFHPFVPLRHLKTVVEGMKRQGWRFVSLRDYPCNVRTDSVWVTSGGGDGHVMAARQYVRRTLTHAGGKIVRSETSPERLREMVTENVSFPPGSFYVLEALDSLPGGGRRRFKDKAAAFLARVFRKGGETGILSLSRVLVLADRKAGREDGFDQSSFSFVLRIFGFHADVRDVSEIESVVLSGYDLVVIPRGSAVQIGDETARTVLEFVENGGLLVLDGRSNLAEMIGFRFLGPEIRVSEVRELSFPGPDLRWTPPADVVPPSAKDAVILAKDAHSDTPLALVKPVEQGRVLFLATLFDPLTPYGMSRFAYLPHYLKDTLGVPFNVRRNNLEFYFDPGFHPTTSLEKLVSRWRASGVKIIYLAAWHFYEHYAFDYPYFIDLCHGHGIAVYAWFEFPQVTPLFWQDHPEWREKTATGADGLCHWRQQMNLFNPDARKAAGRFFRELLMGADWDGVNIAELNFDTNRGASDPAKFTPMNADIRNEFRRRTSIDPLDFFNPASPHYWRTDRENFESFLRFRAEVTRMLHVYFLDEAEAVRRAKGKDLEVIVTAMDSLVHPEIFEECGLDTRDILGLMTTYDFTLQIEDPARSWAEPPSRYLDYFEAYKPHVPDSRRLMFDINCIRNRDIANRPIPSPAAAGVELAATLFYAAFPSGRAAVYSENTVHPFDMDILAYVSGPDVEIRDQGGSYGIRSREPFVLALDIGDFLPQLNGRIWPFYGPHGIAIPSGANELTFRKSGFLDIEDLAYRMMIGGDILDLRRENNVFRFEYRSPLPVPLTFSRPLSGLKIDSHLVAVPSDHNGVVLPRGRHALEIWTESAPARIVDVVGYLTSSGFYLAGILAVSLLAGIYLHTRFTR